jgi:hypothetical protein
MVIRRIPVRNITTYRAPITDLWVRDKLGCFRQKRLVGGISAIPTLRRLRPECRRLCSMLTQNVLCSSWMLVGMTVGPTVFVQYIRTINGMSVTNMLAGMFTGMVWGMVVSVGLYRLFFVMRDRLQRQIG